MADVALPPQVAPGQFVEAVWGNAAVAAIKAAAPPAMVGMFLGGGVPDGWIAMTGNTVTGFDTKYPTTWNELPAAIKTAGGDATFPDTRMKFPYGGTGLGTTGGANAKAIPANAVPKHKHHLNAHTHSFKTGAAGTHGHNLANSANVWWRNTTSWSIAAGNVSGGGGGTFNPWNTSGAGGQRFGVATWRHEGSHTHTGTTNGSNASTRDAGTGANFDVTPAYFEVLFAIRVY